MNRERVMIMARVSMRDGFFRKISYTGMQSP